MPSGPEQLAEVQARLEIMDLEAEYARAWDSGDAEGWAAVFTPEGVFEIDAVGDRPAVRVSGRSELARFCSEFTSHTSGLHLMHLPRLRIEGETAEGGVHFEFRFSRRRDGESVSGTTAGSYLVRYRRTPEGWRMEHRLERPLLRDNRSYLGG